jgi:DNA/RNA-binding protein KIN17
MLAEEKSEDQMTLDSTPPPMPRVEGEKIKLDFAIKPAAESSKPSLPTKGVEVLRPGLKHSSEADSTSPIKVEDGGPGDEGPKLTAPFSLSSGINKPKNVFAAASKNAFGVKKGSASKVAENRRMSQAEKIMKDEIERKRHREANGSDRLGGKRHKVL